MKSLICLILGCKWSEWIHTKTETVWGMIDFDGFGIAHYGWVPKHYGYDKVLSHCKRCGRSNPAYTSYLDSTIVAPDHLGGK